jgi:hypothetical protein
MLLRISLYLLLSSAFLLVIAQERSCASHEYELELRKKHKLPTIEESETVMAQWLQARRNARTQALPNVVRKIPVVFHVIHFNEPVGTGDNLSAALINAQIEQLNFDFRKTNGSLGFNDDPAGADTFIEFVAVEIDPEGNVMAEPGINRVDASSMGWSPPPYASISINGIIKPQTIWDPDRYFNIWVLGTQDGLLGYAQFPNLTGLDGLDDDEGMAETDGVVVLNTSVGGENNPNPDGGNFNLGRTCTHEVGHWLGLRHIWGDGGCGVDDYCADTPLSDAPNYGCPNGHESCGSVDMIENYMDYTNDACMNIFTQDQKARMDVVLQISPRRTSLITDTQISKYQKLIISEVVHGSETGGQPRYVELFNAANNTYVTEDLSIQIYQDGSLTPVTIAIPDGISLAPGDTYVVAQTAFDPAWGGPFVNASADLVDSNLNGDGNDAYALFDEKWGRILDVHGVVGTDGTGEDWEYAQSVVTRKVFVIDINSNQYDSER